ncbi:Hypothetical predicted protein [Podarcis lilfordi]|uniref:Uncharacterized protein n=1 Tax=Podarcis lilfordi TaxID=74358 RepID=A0AA35K017_9SAUR|nr:Hypothetical predicted protein [Podarcis lilfordi]
MEPQIVSPEQEGGLGGDNKPSSVAQSDCVREQPGWKASLETKQEPCNGMQQRWEAQWQEFLTTLQSPHTTENPLSLEAPPMGRCQGLSGLLRASGRSLPVA